MLRIAVAGALSVGVVLAQVGLPARLVSPEIIREMHQEVEREERLSTPVTQREFQKLHDADTEMMRRIIENAKKHAELERYVDTLDISVDTRTLTEARDDIRALKAAQARMEDNARSERDAERAIIQTVKSGMFMLFCGFVVTLAIAILKWALLDPRRRKAMVDKSIRDTAAMPDWSVIIQELKDEIASVKNQVDSAHAQASSAHEALCPVDAKLKEMEQTLQFLVRNQGGGSPQISRAGGGP